MFSPLAVAVTMKVPAFETDYVSTAYLSEVLIREDVTV